MTINPRYTFAGAILIAGITILGCQQRVANHDRVTLRLPGEKDAIGIFQKIDKTLSFTYWNATPDTRFRYLGMQVANKTNPDIQISINVVPHLVEGRPAQAVNVILNISPGSDSTNYQNQVPDCMRTYALGFLNEAVPAIGQTTFADLWRKVMDGPKCDLISETTSTNGNLVFWLKRKECKTQFSVMDIQSHSEVMDMARQDINK